MSFTAKEIQDAMRKFTAAKAALDVLTPHWCLGVCTEEEKKEYIAGRLSSEQLKYRLLTRMCDPFAKKD